MYQIGHSKKKKKRKMKPIFGKNVGNPKNQVGMTTDAIFSRLINLALGIKILKFAFHLTLEFQT